MPRVFTPRRGGQDVSAAGELDTSNSNAVRFVPTDMQRLRGQDFVRTLVSDVAGGVVAVDGIVHRVTSSNMLGGPHDISVCDCGGLVHDVAPPDAVVPLLYCVMSSASSVSTQPGLDVGEIRVVFVGVWALALVASGSVDAHCRLLIRGRDVETESIPTCPMCAAVGGQAERLVYVVREPVRGACVETARLASPCVAAAGGSTRVHGEGAGMNTQLPPDFTQLPPDFLDDEMDGLQQPAVGGRGAVDARAATCDIVVTVVRQRMDTTSPVSVGASYLSWRRSLLGTSPTSTGTGTDTGIGNVAVDGCRRTGSSVVLTWPAAVAIVGSRQIPVANAQVQAQGGVMQETDCLNPVSAALSGPCATACQLASLEAPGRHHDDDDASPPLPSPTAATTPQAALAATGGETGGSIAFAQDCNESVEAEDALAGATFLGTFLNPPHSLPETGDETGGDTATGMGSGTHTAIAADVVAGVVAGRRQDAGTPLHPRSWPPLPTPLQPGTGATPNWQPVLLPQRSPTRGSAHVSSLYPHPAGNGSGGEYSGPHTPLITSLPASTTHPRESDANSSSSATDAAVADGVTGGGGGGGDGGSRCDVDPSGAVAAGVDTVHELHKVHSSGVDGSGMFPSMLQGQPEIGTVSRDTGEHSPDASPRQNAAHSKPPIAPVSYVSVFAPAPQAACGTGATTTTTTTTTSSSSSNIATNSSVSIRSNGPPPASCPALSALTSLSHLIANAHSYALAAKPIELWCILIDGTLWKGPQGKARDGMVRLQVTDISLLTEARGSSSSSGSSSSDGTYHRTAQSVTLTIFASDAIHLPPMTRVGTVLHLSGVKPVLFNGFLGLNCSPARVPCIFTSIHPMTRAVTQTMLPPQARPPPRPAINDAIVACLLQHSRHYLQHKDLFVGTDYAQCIETVGGVSQGYGDFFVCVSQLSWTPKEAKEGGSGVASATATLPSTVVTAASAYVRPLARCWVWDGTGDGQCVAPLVASGTGSGWGGRHSSVEYVPAPRWATMSPTEVCAASGCGSRAPLTGKCTWTALGAVVEVQFHIPHPQAETLLSEMHPGDWLRLRNVNVSRRLGGTDSSVVLHVNPGSGCLIMPPPAASADARSVLSRYMMAVASIVATTAEGDVRSELAQLSATASALVWHKGAGTSSTGLSAATAAKCWVDARAASGEGKDGSHFASRSTLQPGLPLASTTAIGTSTGSCSGSGGMGMQSSTAGIKATVSAEPIYRYDSRTCRIATSLASGASSVPLAPLSQLLTQQDDTDVSCVYRVRVRVVDRWPTDERAFVYHRNDTAPLSFASPLCASTGSSSPGDTPAVADDNHAVAAAASEMACGGTGEAPLSPKDTKDASATSWSCQWYFTLGVVDESCTNAVPLLLLDDNATHFLNGVEAREHSHTHHDGRGGGGCSMPPSASNQVLPWLRPLMHSATWIECLVHVWREDGSITPTLTVFGTQLVRPAAE